MRDRINGRLQTSGYRGRNGDAVAPEACNLKPVAFCSSAFTLVEMVMAMAITAVIATSVAMATMSLSTAQLDGDSYSQSIQASRSVLMRVSANARKAGLITASGSDSVVFWAGDTNGNGLLNVSELTVIAYDAPSKEVREYVVAYPKNLSQANINANNPSMTLAAVDTTAEAKAAILANTYKATRTLASGVTSFKITVDKPVTPISKMMTFEMTIPSTGHSLTLRSAAVLRSPQVQDVGLVSGVYVLSIGSGVSG